METTLLDMGVQLILVLVIIVRAYNSNTLRHYNILDSLTQQATSPHSMSKDRFLSGVMGLVTSVITDPLVVLCHTDYHV